MWWQLQPVQSGAKALAAGTVVCATMWLYSKTTRYISGPKDGNYKALLKNIPKLLHTEIEYMYLISPDWLDILARLEPFRRFAPAEYDAILIDTYEACKVKHIEYQGKLSVTGSLKIRKAFQKIIESTRIFRAILASVMSVAMEDFDEVAVDINSKVEQACTDAIQDSVM
jgi:hypothetical protein